MSADNEFIEFKTNPFIHRPALEIEWGVHFEEYEPSQSATDGGYTEENARIAVAQSPTDRGLRKRYVTKWEEVE